jgi:hypothetical protein
MLRPRYPADTTILKLRHVDRIISMHSLATASLVSTIESARVHEPARVCMRLGIPVERTTPADVLWTAIIVS